MSELLSEQENYMEPEWEIIQPKVSNESEFKEIAGDFGDPFEIFREAMHNAYDWGATKFDIRIFTDSSNGKAKLIIELSDNGDGMDHETLIEKFWGLGFSGSRGDETKIGEKGHGTKIYLKSDKVVVRTSTGKESFESICENPTQDLNAGRVHMPKVRRLKDILPKGTTIRIEGYNDNDMTSFTQDIIEDYLYWHTKIGSVENQFDGHGTPEFEVTLQALGEDQGKTLAFGHKFAKENKDINALFNKYEENAADYFVKKYIHQGIKLENRPDVKIDIVVYVEGDEAKRTYNHMIRQRSDKRFGTYKVADRYGLYLCKDYIPIQKVNDWITNFGTGSNSFVMLHGFINCQELRLTANRGTIANSDQLIMKNIKAEVKKVLEEIDNDLYKNNIATLKQWQQEAKTEQVETTAFENRKKLIKSKCYFKIGERTFLEPRNEAELYGLFMSLYTLHPEHFDFEPLDYDASIGVDLVARNKTKSKIADCQYWYVELKYRLSATGFNHTFKNIRYIVCWDVGKLLDGELIESSVEGDSTRVFRKETDADGKDFYFLDKKGAPIKIQVIPIREYIEKTLGITISNADKQTV